MESFWEMGLEERQTEATRSLKQSMRGRCSPFPVFSTASPQQGWILYPHTLTPKSEIWT